MNRLLSRQLKKLGLNADQTPDLSGWQLFLKLVVESYETFERDKKLIERSLELSSKEMQERWEAQCKLSKQIEQQQVLVVASTKMAALGEMAGGIAHEINNPLAVIKSYASQLEEILDDPSMDRELLKEMSKQISATTDRIAKIIQSLRAFSRDGSHDPFSKVNLKQVIDETFQLCRERFHNSQTNVIIDDFDSNISVQGRSVEISQTLLNLLSNAHHEICKYPDKWIRIGVLRKPDCIEISVTDCGKGIPPDIQHKLFQPFFTTKEAGKGTGLGLSISRKIMENHGGSLQYDSSKQNTCFVMKFPLPETILKDVRHAG